MTKTVRELKSTIEMSSIVDTLVELGAKHFTAIKQQTTLTNMLKQSARDHAGFRALASGDGEKIFKEKAEAFYRDLLENDTDPEFTASVDHLIVAREAARKTQKSLEKAMALEFAELPVAAWIDEQRGCGHAMAAKIVANAGRDLSDYETPAKLWQRFGLAVVDGKAPRPAKGKVLNFSPYRRSIAWQLGDVLIKAGGNEEAGNLSYWKRIYLWRKTYEIKRAEERGLKVVPAASIKKGHEDEFMSQGHVHNRAKRYMEKQFLKAFWEEWTGQEDENRLPDFLEAA